MKKNINLSTEHIISGWGNYPKIKSRSIMVISPNSIPLIDSIIIPRGLGRSYGDSALNGVVADLTKLDKIILFDDKNGILHCQAGVSIDHILSLVVHKGWFLPVTPGTKFITIGGAVAADVHGKNHHKEGSFCDYVMSFNILIGNGERVCCTPEKNKELFLATCGGMGLTGIILDICIRLKAIKQEAMNTITIKAKNIEETLDVLIENETSTYSVAWVDCLKKGEKLGRSNIFLGEHSNEYVKPFTPHTKLNVPVYPPGFFLNKGLIKVFNNICYHRLKGKKTKKLIHYDPYFYPLDAIRNWNRLYGKRGFFQYQFVVPFEVGTKGIRKIMEKITDWRQSPFLGVLKTFGKCNNNLLSFPKRGFTFAFDIKYNKEVFKFFDNMDELILDMNGRIYLAKDARMSESTFKKSYDQWEKFQAIREQYSCIDIFSSEQSRRIGLN